MKMNVADDVYEVDHDDDDDDIEDYDILGETGDSIEVDDDDDDGKYSRLSLSRIPRDSLK